MGGIGTGTNQFPQGIPHIVKCHHQPADFVPPAPDHPLARQVSLGHPAAVTDQLIQRGLDDAAGQQGHQQAEEQRNAETCQCKPDNLLQNLPDPGDYRRVLLLQPLINLICQL